MSGDELARSWIHNAAAWTEAVRGGHLPSRRLGTDAAMLSALRGTGARRVLDLGCGEGWLCRALQAMGVATVGIDASAPLIEAARAAGPGDYRVLAYDDLPAAGEALGRFDAIACNFALFDQDLGPLLRALRARLAPEGRLLVQTLPDAAGGDGAEEGWRLETFAGVAALPFPEPMPWYFRPRAAWLAVLAGAGFRVEHLQEPRHPDTGQPLSLLLVCRAAGPG